MKRNVILLILLMFLMTGCFEAPTEKKTDDFNPEVSTEENVQAKADNKLNERFYPTMPTAQKVSGGDGQSSGDNFIITQELQVKLFLVDKYNPGTCYGIPGPVPEVAISGMISKNSGLAKFLRGQYNLPTDLDVYNKMKQINGISLDKVSGGSYEFKFIDGRCCTLNAVRGNISIIGQNIDYEVTDRETKTNPC